MRRSVVLCVFLFNVAGLNVFAAEDGLTRDEAVAALKKAVGFYSGEVSIEGGYLWRYSADLSEREGEREASRTTAWVQPPGTPSVGMALLRAYELSGELVCLAAAMRTAHALVAGQLRSGGWDYRIEFDPNDRRRYAYRVDGDDGGERNVTTLDDNTTQSALLFLMQIDKALEFEDERIHEARRFGLESLLKAQYPNGAWPQRYSAFPDPDEYPVKQAGYPESRPRTWPDKNYRGYYTFNDNSIADVIDVMFAAAEIYGEERFRRAAEKAGDFMILAQMPEPQPGWAQQYDREMHPAWARKFEPASITGGESQGVMRTLLKLYERTGKKKYLEPIPRALAYYKRSLLPDGRLARFYELKTNRPLYFVKDTYELTYSSDNMPTHYGFIVGSRLDVIEAEYNRLRETDPETLKRRERERPVRMSDRLAREAQHVAAGLDARGAWVEEGRLRSGDSAGGIIESRTFAENIVLLGRFIAAAGDAEE